jgi:hypothetical protein
MTLPEELEHCQAALQQNWMSGERTSSQQGAHVPFVHACIRQRIALRHPFCRLLALGHP